MVSIISEYSRRCEDTQLLLIIMFLCHLAENLLYLSERTSHFLAENNQAWGASLKEIWNYFTFGNRK
jgi:hypothetical protein